MLSDDIPSIVAHLKVLHSDVRFGNIVGCSDMILLLAGRLLTAFISACLGLRMQCEGHLQICIHTCIRSCRHAYMQRFSMCSFVYLPVKTE